jgi:hypothetical protein
MKRRTKNETSRARLDEMVAEATVDCYNDTEQAMGLFNMVEDHLNVPFETIVLGVRVTVTGVEMAEDDRIVAVCVRGKARQAIPILDLALPTPPPAGAEWIDAYRHWAGGG